MRRIRQSLFTATASHSESNAANALDRNPNTRWDTGAPQEPGMWFQLDLGVEDTVGGLILDTEKSGGDWPAAYEVYVFNDEADQGEPVARGDKGSKILDIDFEPKAGRYVRVVQTGKKDGLFWSIHRLTVKFAD